jgi:hypothetical protein
LLARIARKPPKNDKDDGPAVNEIGAGDMRP